MMKQRDWTYRAFGPGYSRDKDGGREMEGREGHFQLGKGGARRETDLAVALLDFACCRARQAALRSARAIPRSRVACGAFNVDFTAIWALLGCFLPEIAEISAISGVDAGTGNKKQTEPSATGEH